MTDLFSTQVVVRGDCLERMKEMDPCSIDCILTDPPYGLHFMGKDWDHFNRKNFDESTDHKRVVGNGRDRQMAPVGIGNALAGTYDPKRDDEFQTFMCNVGRAMLRVLKPGGHLLMFGSPRRHHRQMCGLEDAGFEIRDCMQWIFGQGFPKSHNIGKKLGGVWEGFGTALKPAYEPIIVAMKPLDGTFANNAEKWGVAGINVDACRIGTDEKLSIGSGKVGYCGGYDNTTAGSQHEKGRWPANVIFDEVAGEMLDEMSGESKSSNRQRNNKPSPNKCMSGENTGHVSFGHNDSGGASRFFYCAKASSAERGEDNVHPTVKPTKLLEYLLKLIMPPFEDAVVLDPFVGSGSTLVAAKSLGFNAVGIEISDEYADIAEQRIA